MCRGFLAAAAVPAGLPQLVAHTSKPTTMTATIDR
jgi:hypothetical protein